MASFMLDFQGGFPVDEIGVITGSSTYTRFPNRPGELFRLKAQSTNIGSFSFGTNTGSFFGMGVGSQIAFELNAGEDTDWFKVMGNNLNSLFYSNPSGSSETLTYWLQR